MHNSEFHLFLNTDRNLVAREVPSQRVLEIAVQAPEAVLHTVRPRLNLALILDRSGSMSGEKLEYVKQAAAHVLDLLGEQDRAALVAYDNKINLLSPSVPITPGNRNELKSIIHNLRSGGSTNLSGGWLAGCQEIAASMGEGTLNRALLLTDGQANEGIMDPDELARHARELTARGISTSTFGVGQGFNEHLLELMSNQGSGNFYYISDPTDIPGVFAREFKELVSVTARDVEVTLEVPAQVSAQVLGGWRTETLNGQMHIFVGNLLGGRTQEIYVKLLTPPSIERSTIVFRVKGSAKGEGGERFEDQAEMTYQYASQELTDASPRKQDILERFASVDLAENANEALKLERSGKKDEAKLMLDIALEANRPFAAPAQAAEYESLSNRMKRGLDEDDRKASHFNAYNQKRRRDQ
jgi:Ca-activated chloride channel homolog